MAQAPSPSGTTEASRLLARWRAGEEGARDRFFSLIYEDLRRRARRELGRHGPATLSPTTLVHEAFLKLVEHGEVSWVDRSHFLAVASLAMRQILVDHARRRLAVKRGGGEHAGILDEATLRLRERAAELLALDAALERLRSLDERLACVVELRFFGGLSFEEVGAVLALSPRTVKRDWWKARAFLSRILGGDATA